MLNRPVPHILTGQCAAFCRSLPTVCRSLPAVALILALLLPAQIHAQATEQADPPTLQATLQDRETLTAFIDGLMAAHMEELHIPGAVVVIVADGEIILAEGYGYAELEDLTPVDPASTLFRIGSVSKLFVWTAAMQLVEAGELELDEDVNTYLAATDVRIPPTYFEPVTMYDLMAHSAGFEDRILELFARDPAALAPLDTLLEDFPARVRPPGQYSAYSNHGTALAALVVEEVSGIPFADYVETEILAPLAMDNTTIAQPLPETMQADMARGYTYRGGRQVAEDFEYIPLAPAGAISATGLDMARFMLAHLQLGTLGGAQILSADTAATMQTQHFTHAPTLPGIAHGFIESSVHGERWIGHLGDTLQFHTGFYLQPERNVGVFVAYNGAGASPARERLLEAFSARYFLDQEPIVPTPPTIDPGQLAPYTGNFRTTRMPHTTPDKFAGLATSLTVSADPDGLLVISGLGLEPMRLTEIGPGRFRQVEPTGVLGNLEVAFRDDPETGEPASLFLSMFPFMAFERVPWILATNTQLLLLGSALLLALIAVFAWPIHGWRSRSRPGRASRWGQWAYGLGALSALLVILYAVTLAVSLADPMQLAFGAPPALRAGSLIPLPLLLLVVGMVGLTGWLWVRGIWRTGGRIFYTLVTLAFVGLLWQLWYWNLLTAWFSF